MTDIPKNIEAEKAVLGSILHKNNLIFRIKLKPNDFYQSKNQKIFTAMLEIVEEFGKIDFLTLSEKIGESAYIAELINSTPYYENIEHYAKIVQDKATLRKLLTVGQSIAQLVNESPENALEQANKLLLAIRNGEDNDVKEAKALIDIYEDAQAEYNDRNGDIIGLKSGFTFFDEIIDGIRKGHLWVIGGATSVGKSFFALNIVLSLLQQKKRVIFYSLEMSPLDITQRLVGMISKINGIKALKGYLNEEEKDRISEAKQFIYDSKLAIYKGEPHWDRLKLSMLEQNNKEPVDCFFIDYIQQIESNERTQYDTLRVVSKQLQTHAQVIGVPIITFSQLNNESVKGESASIGFKGSGDIANSADLGIELRLDEDDKIKLKEKYEKGELLNIKVIAKKNRHGRMGSTLLYFDNKIGKFYEAN